MVQGALEEEKGEIELSRAQRKELKKKEKEIQEEEGKKTPISGSETGKRRLAKIRAEREGTKGKQSAFSRHGHRRG